MSCLWLGARCEHSHTSAYSFHSFLENNFFNAQEPDVSQMRLHASKYSLLITENQYAGSCCLRKHTYICVVECVVAPFPKHFQTLPKLEPGLFQMHTVHFLNFPKSNKAKTLTEINRDRLQQKIGFIFKQKVFSKELKALRYSINQVHQNKTVPQSRKYSSQTNPNLLHLSQCPISQSPQYKRGSYM